MSSITFQNNNISAKHFEAFFECAAIGILFTDNEGTITAINDFALREFGYRKNEMVGKKIEILIPQRFHHSHVDHRKKYTASPHIRPMGGVNNLLAVTKSGEEIPVEISLANHQSGGEEFVIAFISNIAARKKAEAEIVRLNDQLEKTVEQRTRDLQETLQKLEAALEKEKELSELKSRFLTMASHEFRTPLSTVLSSAYLIEKYAMGEDQPKREKHVQRIVSSVNLLTDILNDFLSVGKIEEGKIQVRPCHFNMEEFVKAINEEIKNNLKAGQKINYHHEGDTEVSLDTSLLKHIILNLVSNASKFSPESGLIKIKTVNRNNKITLSVKDNGIGISKEDQKHLMERFFRGTNAGNIQGTGLGLHLVSKYAELMNGKVECRSEIEKGTEFKITINVKSP